MTDTGPSGNIINNAIVTYDGAVGKPAGSCYVELDWPVGGNGGNWEDCKIDENPPGWPGTDISGYQSIDFDLKVDTVNSTLATDGTYGGVGVVCRSWASGPVGHHSLVAAKSRTPPLGSILPVR